MDPVCEYRGSGNDITTRLVNLNTLAQTYGYGGNTMGLMRYLSSRVGASYSKDTLVGHHPTSVLRRHLNNLRVGRLYA